MKETQIHKYFVNLYNREFLILCDVMKRWNCEFKYGKDGHKGGAPTNTIVHKKVTTLFSYIKRKKKNDLVTHGYSMEKSRGSI